MRVLKRLKVTIALFLYTHLFILILAQLISLLKTKQHKKKVIFVQINLLKVCQTITIKLLKSRDLMPEVVLKNKLQRHNKTKKILIL